MSEFSIKICGVTRPADAILAMSAGADAIGLNFFPQSIRFVSPETAGEIAAALVKQARETSDAAPLLVGVFVNASYSTIIETTVKAKLNFVQLHGDETPEFLSKLQQRFATSNVAPKYIRALRVKRSSDAPIAAEELNKLVDEINQWHDLGAGILLDARVAGAYGGTGEQVDWELIPQLHSLTSARLILAGGLTPWNVEEAIRETKAAAVDVASGVEDVPGEKSPHRIREFVKSALAGFQK